MVAIIVIYFVPLTNIVPHKSYYCADMMPSALFSGKERNENEPPYSLHPLQPSSDIPIMSLFVPISSLHPPKPILVPNAFPNFWLSAFEFNPVPFRS